MAHRITKLKITNYRGIEAREIDVPPHGAIVKGGNGRGKTSVLRAIRAALAAQDIGPDAIHGDAEKAEILVDMGDVTVRRAITRKGTPNLTVTTKDGFKAPKPQTYLAELLGTSALDPLDFFLAKPKERRALVLAATPLTVTREQLEGVVGSRLDVSTDGHGLEVVARVQKLFYDARTGANAAAKAARETAERAAAAAEECKSAPGAATIGEAQTELDAAKSEAARLYHQAEAAKRSREAGERTRQQIATLRENANAERAGLADEIDVHPLATAVDQAKSDVESARRALEAAKTKLAHAEVTLEEALDANDRRRGRSERARTLDEKARAMEETLAATSFEDVSDEQYQAIKVRVEAAQVALESARRSAKGAELEEASRAAGLAANAAAQKADRLDRVVKSLAELPSKLLAECDGIPGLTLDGDEIYLDGVRLDGLCGAEQMRFAIDLAKRANAKSRILIVDKLEQLDPEQMDAFVAHATDGGWQLIATRVDRGDVVVEAIEPMAQAAAE